jgi:hypothetical protein
MKKRKARNKVAKAEKKPVSVPVEKNNDLPDFGGLPAWDLKKNLGCG